jgi:SAM-dependent methyltransferase
MWMEAYVSIHICPAKTGSLKIVHTDLGRSGSTDLSYNARVASEIGIYRDCVDVHNLPPVFHYWSNRYLRPKMEPHGFSDPPGMFLLAFGQQCAKHAGASKVRFLSAGSGNCDTEVAIATGLRAKGYTDFTIECLDLNPSMLQRGARYAQERGVANNMEFVEADLNTWTAQREYHAVMADQSLHHVMELEWLFGQIRQSLHPAGTFVISDMIGRNGHLRWPRALAIVREFWKSLPPAYRYNCASGRYEAVFQDADCSSVSFEGIRAQDIVPLLKLNFDFRLAIGFGNIIDPFIDRSFGPNFDPSRAWDREFIDRVHRRDEEEISSGRLLPTHLLAMLSPLATAANIPAKAESEQPVPSLPAGLPSNNEESGYEWNSWPHSPAVQLARACRMLEESEERTGSAQKELDRVIAIAQQLRTEFEERTEWASRLNEELSEAKASRFLLERELSELAKRTEWARRLESELAERTAWALQLRSELEQVTGHVPRLETVLAERTAWALSLDDELAERTAWALRLDRELAEMRRSASIPVRRFAGLRMALARFVRLLTFPPPSLGDELSEMEKDPGELTSSGYEKSL